MWCDHSKEKEMSACKKIMLNSSHSKGQDYLSFVSPFDVCLSLMFFLVFVDSSCKDMLSKSTLSDWFSCFYSQKSYWSWFKRLWVILQSQSFRPHELSTLGNSFIEMGGLRNRILRKHSQPYKMDLLVEQDFVIRLEVLNDYILQVKRSWTHWQQNPSGLKIKAFKNRQSTAKPPC